MRYLNNAGNVYNVILFAFALQNRAKHRKSSFNIIFVEPTNKLNRTRFFRLKDFMFRESIGDRSEPKVGSDN